MIPISEKREAALIMGRAGISEAIIELARDIATGSYKNAIEKGGEIHALIDACTFDEYWEEKANIGKHNQGYKMLRLIGK